MTPLKITLAAVLLLAADYPPSPAYFSNVRQVQTVPAQSQNFIVMDDSIWSHTYHDLADLRLYDGQSQVPFALREQRAGVATVERTAKILNLGTVSGHTEFDLEIAPGEAEEYNRVQLELSAKDFVTEARVEGKNEVRQKESARLGSSTLYDFTRENLGSNSTLTVPLSSFRYLHIRLGAGIRPAQVTGATISRLEEKKAIWRDAGSCTNIPPMERQASPPAHHGATVLQCTAPTSVPIERVALQVPAGRINFRRNLIVEKAAGDEVARGTVSRVRITRGGQSVITEDLAVDLPSARSSQFTVTIENGDDAPLPIDRVQLLSVERRIYFNPEGKPQLTLYYGDEKLNPPTYDYEQFFREDPAAAEAKLGPDQHNQSYTGRPDDRPWSERHKNILWIVMILAVGTLLAVAARGLRTRPTN